MKNKKNIYFLLPAVILVWGFLGYRIFSTVKPTNNTQQQIAITQFKPKQLQEAETFTINTNYRDPFLGTFSPKKSVKLKSKSVRVATQKPIVPFPNIVYKGVVSPKGKKGQVFLIAINGQQFFYKKKATHKEVKLIRGNNKEVVLKFQGLQQTFPLAK